MSRNPSWMRAVLGCPLKLAAIVSSLSFCHSALIAPAAAATVVAPQQLTVTAANAAGDSIYDLALATSSSGALISGIQALNSDGSKHGSFDALVWSPNAFTGTLDLIVADATKGQILRYAGPNYGTSSVIFSYTTKGSGPAYPAGLAVDASGNLFIISPSAPLSATPALWAVPFNKATGAWAAPVLIDQSFGGVKTSALAEVLVAGTAATAAGSAAPAWNAGDVLVLVGDTFDSRLIVYSQAAVRGVLATPKVPLTGPTSTPITMKQFSGQFAAPFGMDIWPSDATHGVSLLFTTIDGRILRFDTKQGTFTGNFASGLGFGLTKLRVGSYAGTPYAFVAQLGAFGNGQILQFGAPSATGTNKALASVSRGVSEPIGLALVNSGSVAASSCVAPSSCSPLGPQLTVQISGPGASKIPAGATILQQACTVPTDPRVAVVNGVWSCLGPTINMCGTTPTPGCVPATLDVANYCPGFPSTILPATMCGHAGASGAAFQVVKGTAVLLDQNANDLYLQSTADPTVVLPGSYDLKCQMGMGQYGPLFAFAPRSDLPTVEGTIVEDAAAPYFNDVTGFCDNSGGNSHVESMFAFGLGLNVGANGLGASGGLYGFISTKFNDLTTTLQQASPQITPTTVTTTLENYVTQSQNYFNSDYHHDVNDYSCALNSIASADVYLRNQAQGTAFTYTAPAAGNNNPNPAGEIDSRLANLYLSISGDFLYAPNPTWPTTNVPPCVTLSITAANNSAAVGGTATLTFGPPTPQFASTPLLSVPAQCTLSASDGTFTTPAMVLTSGSVSSGKLTKSGTYTATLECAGAGTDTSSSFATASVPVSSTPILTSITVTPTPPAPASVPDGQTQQFIAMGNYSSGPSSTLSSVVWGTSNGVATVNASGLATCLTVGSSSITATSGSLTASSVTGQATLMCTGAVLTSVTVSPNPGSTPAGTQLQFAASGINSLHQSVTPMVTWTSGTAQVAIVTGSGGLATCLTTGTSIIQATNVTTGGASTSGNATLNCLAPVLASLAVTPATAAGFVGGTVQFADTAKDSLGNSTTPGPVTWTSGNTAVASISPTGMATCLTPGSASITATSVNISSNSALLTCTAATLTLSANPATTPINHSVTLTWTSNLPASESCTLTSNSSDAPLTDPAQPPNGMLNTTDGVAQIVTYTINCAGAASAQAQVLYTLATTYQYTGNQFPSYDAYEQYSNADRVIASITVSVPFAPNLSSVDVTGVPGFALTMSDGIQTLPPASGTRSYATVSTDANGNISAWSVANNASGFGISTQYPVDGTADLGYIGPGVLCESPTDCGSIANAAGAWTSSNVQSLHVIFGTTSGSNPSSGQLYQAVLGGTTAAPTLSVPTILSETPQPAACFGGPTGVSGLAAAITGLALVPNSTSGYSDLVASNGLQGDVFRLSGPSYQPTSDINDASPNCWNTGPSAVSVAADSAADVVGAGHDINTYLPSLYYFPPGASNQAPNFVLMDYPNDDPSLTSCGSTNGAATENSGCVGSLVDTVVVQNAAAGAGVAAGDMLVLIGDAYAGNGNPVVLRYPAAAIQTAKAYATQCPASFGDTSGTPPPCVANSGGSQLITQSVVGTPNLPNTLTLLNGDSPMSMDISPIDGSLFIATSQGNIYQLVPNSTGYRSTLYASNVFGVQQVRVGQLAGVLYVFATVQNDGANGLMEFVGPAPGSAMASVTLDGTPAGLSVH